MVKKNIEEELGLNSKIDYKSNDQDVEKVFKERGEDRIRLLEESMQDINDMVSDRATLHKEMLSGFKEIDIFINNNMPDLGGATTEAIKVRQDLMKELLKKKIELEQLKVEEKLNFWRDTALLKKEFREHMKELRDMESKSSMIDSMIGL